MELTSTPQRRASLRSTYQQLLPDVNEQRRRRAGFQYNNEPDAPVFGNESASGGAEMRAAGPNAQTEAEIPRGFRFAEE